MTMQIEPSSRDSKTKLLDVNRSPNGFFQLSSQFLASTTANMTRDTCGREPVLLEKQYSPATVAKKIAALKSFLVFAMYEQGR